MYMKVDGTFQKVFARQNLNLYVVGRGRHKLLLF
jgi:hypothetical protein